MAKDMAAPDMVHDAGAQREARISEIHATALAELTAPTGDVPHWALYGELQQLRTRPFRTDWLEAVIMVAGIGRIRPAKMVGHLNKLRHKRNVQNQAELFQTFLATLRAYMGDDRLTNHAFGSETFADLDHDSVWRHVERHLGALRDEGYEVFLNSGTLLGVVRDARLIEHDDDIDLALLLKARTEAEAAAEWLTLRTRLEELDLFDAETFKQAAIYKLKPVGTTQIDLFPAWIEDDKVFVYPHTHGQLSRGDVLPLQTCAVTGNALPAEPEKMLALNYGKGWVKPDPFFKFPWRSANARFAPFLERLQA